VVSEALGELVAVVVYAERLRARVRPGAKGLIGVAVVGLASTAIMRVMYRTVLGEGIGELEAAMRTLGLGDAPDGDVLCHDSFVGMGERAKLGILKVSFAFERGTSLAALSCVTFFVSLESCGDFGGLDALFVPPMLIPSRT